MCASDKEGLTEFVEGTQVPVLSRVTHEVIAYDPDAGFEQFRYGPGRTVDLFVPLLLLATLALLIEGWLANPRRSRVSDSAAVQDTQGTPQAGPESSPVVDTRQQVLVNGRAG